MVAAFAAETEVAEGEAKGPTDGGGVAVAIPPKPKKGKAALPLKRDRVRPERLLVPFVRVFFSQTYFAFILDTSLEF